MHILPGRCNESGTGPSPRLPSLLYGALFLLGVLTTAGAQTRITLPRTDLPPSIPEISVEIATNGDLSARCTPADPEKRPLTCIVQILDLSSKKPVPKTVQRRTQHPSSRLLRFTWKGSDLARVMKSGASFQVSLTVLDAAQNRASASRTFRYVLPARPPVTPPQKPNAAPSISRVELIQDPSGVLVIEFAASDPERGAMSARVDIQPGDSRSSQGVAGQSLSRIASGTRQSLKWDPDSLAKVLREGSRYRIRIQLYDAAKNTDSEWSDEFVYRRPTPSNRPPVLSELELRLDHVEGLKVLLTAIDPERDLLELSAEIFDGRRPVKGTSQRESQFRGGRKELTWSSDLLTRHLKPDEKYAVRVVATDPAKLSTDKWSEGFVFETPPPVSPPPSPNEPPRITQLQLQETGSAGLRADLQVTDAENHGLKAELRLQAASLDSDQSAQFKRLNSGESIATEWSQATLSRLGIQPGSVRVSVILRDELGAEVTASSPAINYLEGRQKAPAPPPPRTTPPSTPPPVPGKRRALPTPSPKPLPFHRRLPRSPPLPRSRRPR